MFPMIGERTLHRGGRGSVYTGQEIRERTGPVPGTAKKSLTVGLGGLDPDQKHNVTSASNWHIRTQKSLEVELGKKASKMCKRKDVHTVTVNESR